MPSQNQYYPSASAVLKKLQNTKLMKKRTKRLHGVPDLFDIVLYGEVVNDHDYVARYMMMTVPGYWEGWLEACQTVADDKDRRRSAFSSHETLVEFRNKRTVGKKPTEMPFAISNAYGSALMHVVKRHVLQASKQHPWLTRIQTSTPLRLVPDVMKWITPDANGNTTLPLPQ